MGKTLRKSFFLIATQPFVGLNFLSAICKKIALPLFGIMGHLLWLITSKRSYDFFLKKSFSALPENGNLINLLYFFELGSLHQPILFFIIFFGIWVFKFLTRSFLYNKDSNINFPTGVQ